MENPKNPKKREKFMKTKKSFFASWQTYPVRILFILASCTQLLHSSDVLSFASDESVTKLQIIHSKLKLVHGSFDDEYPEQLMTAMFLPSDAKVLELGGNMGRNSCVIASILEDSRNLVVLESDKGFAGCLQRNRDCNALQFRIEASALSKIPLIQSGWNTIPSTVDLPGYFRVDTIDFNTLQRKYEIVFDTLVADCEGALYHILKDDPEILTNIKLIIIENDYLERSQFEYTLDMFKTNGFNLIYNQTLTINNRALDSVRKEFYQVWKK